MSITVRAAAKINLHLGVGAPREDGFHPLDTVYQAISLYDDVTVSHAEQDSISVRGAAQVDLRAVPTDGSNIALRALAEAPCGAGHSVRIEKDIPVAGGMAGGLIAALVAWGLPAHVARAGARVLKQGGFLIGVRAYSAEDARMIRHILEDAGITRIFSENAGRFPQTASA